jgi:hypothetical protein
MTCTRRTFLAGMGAAAAIGVPRVVGASPRPQRRLVHVTRRMAQDAEEVVNLGIGGINLQNLPIKLLSSRELTGAMVRLGLGKGFSDRGHTVPGQKCG